MEDLLSTLDGTMPDGANLLAPGQFRLSQIQLVNWGTFCGHHVLDVPRRGLLITGESGSGKSSLLDALSALMVSPSDIRFNAAASGTAKGDAERSPVSYVRGAHRKLSDATTREIRTHYLRPGPTASAISMTWQDGLGATVSAIRLFHIKGSSTAAQDLRTSFVLTDGPVRLEQWMPLISRGMDAKRLKNAFPGIVVENTYRALAARLRSKLHLRTETAQKLLHRAMAAKSLSSLDHLFRVFMLDEPETFAEADKAVEQFVELREAHEAVVDARERVTALSPLQDTWDKRATHLETAERLKRLQSAWPVLEAQLNRDNALANLERSETELVVVKAQEQETARRLEDASVELERTQTALLEQGGAALTGADRQLQEAERLHRQVLAAHASYRTRLAELSIPLPRNAMEHSEAVQAAQREIGVLSAASDQTEMGQAFDKLRAANETIEATETELRSLSKRRSRVPANLAGVRDQIAQAIGSVPTALPFAAELADINDPEWAGALERLMGGFARTLVVPNDVFTEVAGFVNSTHLGLRLEFVRADLNRSDAHQTDPRSAARKLTVAHGRFHDWMAAELSHRFKHVCVLNVQEMGEHERSLTRQGLVRDKRRHVKDDRGRIDDQRNWVIGTSNDELVDRLREQLEDARDERASAQKQLDKLESQAKRRGATIRQLERVVDTPWESVDVGTAHTRVEQAERFLSTLRDRHSGLAPLQARIDELKAFCQELGESSKELHARAAVLESDIARSKDELDRADEVLSGTSISTEDKDELQTRLKKLGRSTTPAALRHLGDKVLDQLSSEEEATRRQLNALEASLVRHQQIYVGRWPSHSANLVAAGVESTPDFLKVLSKLKADRLPEFEARFHELLRNQSQQNVVSLSSTIRKAVSSIRDKIKEVNDSLARTPFDRQRDRYLRIEVRELNSQEVKQFLTDLTSVTTGALDHTYNQAEAERRFVTMKRLLERLGSADSADLAWRNRVLDTRRHVTFVATEHDPGGNQMDVYQGSGGRSGGQSQKLVTFCLAAALRYQLAESHSAIPSYGTVALDEAFDKTDANFTRASLAVFDTFRFQLVLATPLKMLQTIEAYVGGAATISNITGTNSTISQLRFTTHEVPPAATGGTPTDAASMALPVPSPEKEW